MDQRTSRFLAMVLRHDPGKLGIKLDASGWVSIDIFLAAMRRSGRRLDRDGLLDIVENNDKKRFTLSEDGLFIRAAQGHSAGVVSDLAITESVPDGSLYHGTARQNLDRIYEFGLLPMKRSHVHLSVDVETATKVGSRHGKPVVLLVDVPAMIAAGHRFWRADNGVWLTDQVPGTFLRVAPGSPRSA